METLNILSGPYRYTGWPVLLFSLLLFGLLSSYSLQLHGASVIEEVVVTAQRREQRASDVPISIAQFSGNELKQLGISDTADLSKAIPGFTHAESGFNLPIFTIRGVGLNETSQTASSTVAIYIDEANLPYPAMARGSNIDIQRVEVLKGPQGTLFGRNTTGGVVNYIPNRPTHEVDFGLSATYERFDKYTVEGFASGNLVENLNGRLVYRESQAREGWQKSLTRPSDTLGEERKRSARFIGEWTPIETVILTFTSEWWQDKSDSQAAQAVEFSPQNKSNSDDFGDEAALHSSVRDHPLVPKGTQNMRLADWPADRKWRLNDRFIMHTLKASWDVSGITINYLGSYQDYQADDSSISLTGLSVENADTILNVDIKAYSNELRFSGLLWETFDWTVGVFSSRDEVSEQRDMLSETNSNNILVPSSGQNMVASANTQIGNQDAKSDAIFFNTEWWPLHYLGLNLGVRYTNERREFEGCSYETFEPRPEQIGASNLFNAISISQGGSGGVEPGECFTLNEEGEPGLIRRKLNEDNISGRFSVNWKPVDDMLFYLSYARGFKSGGFPTPPGASADQFVPAKQEKLNAVEMGGKLFLLDRRLQLNIAAFDYDYKDKQLLSNILDPFFGALPALANIPDSSVRGAEFDIRYMPTAGLLTYFSASYVDTKINRFVGIDERGNAEDFAGNRFNFTPKWEYLFLANYSIPVNRIFDIHNYFNIELGADYSFSGKTNSQLSANPDFTIDSYNLLNYRLGISSPDDRWSLMFWGKNVTNEYYVSNVQTVGDTIARFTGRPQTYGVTFAWAYQ